jgi:squalene-hopene/tetraprenyl-beta-curcumene cyclase
MLDHDRLKRAYDTARRDLLAERNEHGHWTGELASSALSTATALSALALARPELIEPAPNAFGDRALSDLVPRGVAWLVKAQNPDGGWGDTDKSLSNIATTMLVVAALHLTRQASGQAEVVDRAQRYIRQAGGVAGLRARYGRDKTFAVPILANCALAGLVPWTDVAPLPFEAACLPQSWYRLARLPVVSYAIPALVAVGQARFVHAPPRFRLLRWLRSKAVNRSLEVLLNMQPASGGYLEATPLTSFVVMSLAGSGRINHPVCRNGVAFLLGSVRPDGSWPIDTNLAGWLTTLAVQACEGSHSESLDTAWLPWLLDAQQREPHPFTGAAPGGWGWTDLSGSVPDADDTSSALLTLAALTELPDDQQQRIEPAARAAAGWLLDLQNRDGGWPTFCRGWGKLPFDRSGTDLTAHALRALAAWHDRLLALPAASEPADQRRHLALERRLLRARERGFAFLARSQRPDGSWVPLWFGDQYHPHEENPIYGTARVLLAYRDLGSLDSPQARRGLAWLVARQNADGGWGNRWRGLPAAEPRSSVEETSLAVEALLAEPEWPGVALAAEGGLAWLVERAERGEHRETTPLGFYFAKLWYYEKLYPLVFLVRALGKALAPEDRRARGSAVATASGAEA